MIQELCDGPSGSCPWTDVFSEFDSFYLSPGQPFRKRRTVKRNIRDLRTYGIAAEMIEKGGRVTGRRKVPEYT